MKEIDKAIGKIINQRKKILESFAEAYLAALVPDKNLTSQWIAKHIELVEQQTTNRDGELTWCWYFRKRRYDCETCKDTKTVKCPVLHRPVRCKRCKEQKKTRN